MIKPVSSLNFGNNTNIANSHAIIPTQVQTSPIKSSVDNETPFWKTKPVYISVGILTAGVGIVSAHFIHKSNKQAKALTEYLVDKNQYIDDLYSGAKTKLQEHFENHKKILNEFLDKHFQVPENKIETQSYIEKMTNAKTTEDILNAENEATHYIYSSTDFIIANSAHPNKELNELEVSQILKRTFELDLWKTQNVFNKAMEIVDSIPQELQGGYKSEKIIEKLKNGIGKKEGDLTKNSQELKASYNSIIDERLNLYKSTINNIKQNRPDFMNEILRLGFSKIIVPQEKFSEFTGNLKPNDVSIIPRYITEHPIYKFADLTANNELKYTDINSFFNSNTSYRYSTDDIEIFIKRLTLHSQAAIVDNNIPGNYQWYTQAMGKVFELNAKLNGLL